MGITGLLPFLEKSSRKINIKEFSGGTAAIDTYCWLHKGVFSCADKLMMGQTTDAYVLYCKKYISMLLKYKIKPILVFDGRQLPAKEHTEIKRRESRQINRRKAMELIKMGHIAEGQNFLKRAIDINHEIALQLIKYCQNENIDCIVAPYEADAQMAYLNISGIADVVITEDSDLTLFGCKKILFKMDINGNGVLIEQDRLHLAMDLPPEKFDMDKFRYICILSGCDYLPSLPGIGLGKARKFITRNTDENIYRALTRIGSALNMKSLVVTQEYRDAFILADITFRHQLVFCPLQRKQVRLNPPTVDVTDDQLRYAGEELNADLALQLALGNCDPATLKMMHDFDPDKIIERKRKRTVEMTSIWSSTYELKAKDHVSSSKSAINLPITHTPKKEQTVRRNSLRDIFVSSKLHNSQTVQCNKLSASDENLNDKDILDMYSNQNVELLASPEQKSKQFACTGNERSPDLTSKNPFVRRVSDLKTSPSILSSGNCRKRGRNLMRIRKTIVDENAVVESKYFSQQNGEKHEASELENLSEVLIEDVDVKNANCNIIPDTDSISHANIDDQASRELLETFVNNSLEEINNTSENERPTNFQEDVLEKSCFNDTSPTNCKTDKTYVLNDLSTFSNSNVQSTDTINDHKSPYNLQNTMFKWPNTENCRVSSPRKLDNFKRPNSRNLVSRVSSPHTPKRPRQSKQSPTSSQQQGLLSMYGFKKRSTIKH